MFKVYGVDNPRCHILLEEFSTYNEAISWAKRYSQRENAGGYSTLMVKGDGRMTTVHAVAMEG